MVDIPNNLKDEAEKLRGQLIEAVAEYDENLLEKYFEDPNSISEDEVHNALRAATQEMKIIPHDLRILIQKQRSSILA